MKLINLTLLILFFIIGCNPKPKEITYGIDACEYCKMTIVDPKWGAELVTNKGKAYKFDVVECMVAYYLTEIKDKNTVHSLWTINFLEPKTFLDAKTAFYIRTREFQSPMGLNVISLKNERELSRLPLKQEYEILNWDSVVKAVEQELLEN